MFRKQDYVTFIIIKTISHDLLVQVAYYEEKGQFWKDLCFSLNCLCQRLTLITLCMLEHAYVNYHYAYKTLIQAAK